MDEASAVHYNLGVEVARLTPDGEPSIELVRTLDLLERFLPHPPVSILDVGGGPGVYASILARRGHVVHLVDIVQLHVEQAEAASAAQPDASFTSALGDARRLEEADESWDAVLLLGPLSYPMFLEIAERGLRDGQHRNPQAADRPDWFTTAYLHRPDELADELEEAGFALEAVFGVEGPGWLFEGWWSEPSRREIVLRAARFVEQEPALRAISGHLLVVGRKA